MEVRILCAEPCFIGKEHLNDGSFKNMIENEIIDAIIPIYRLVNPLLLRSIDIIAYKPDFYAKANLIVINNKPFVDINVIENVIDQLLKPDQAKHKEAIHIIHHELCHAKDIENLCSMINCTELPDFNLPMKTPTDLLYSLGYEMWGEYISYRNSFSTYSNMLSSQYLKGRAKDADVHLILFVNEYSIKEECSLFNFTRDHIYGFFYALCRELGYCHASNNTIFRPEINGLINMPNTNLGNFVTIIETQLLKMYSTYPSWTGKDILVEFGNKLFQLYQQYGITFDNKKDNQIGFIVDKTAIKKIKPNGCANK